METVLDRIREINRTAAFNRWAGFEVVEAGEGVAALRMPWRVELGQYAGNLHAGLMSALIDTSCGYAASSLGGRVVASHCAVNYLRPGSGSAFVATARVVKAGRRQIFTVAELRAETDGEPVLIATGETIFVPLG